MRKEDGAPVEAGAPTPMKVISAAVPYLILTALVAAAFWVYIKGA